MVKNAADVIFGGLSYWAFGYGISFGADERYASTLFAFFIPSESLERFPR